MIDKIDGEKGFTLLEMMVVLIIIAVLISLGIRIYVGYIDGSKITRAKGDLTAISAALDSYYATSGAYPSSTDAALTLAGLSTCDVGSAGTSRMYYIGTSATPGYEVYTATQPDRVNYVVATGFKGLTTVSPMLASALPSTP